MHSAGRIFLAARETGTRRVPIHLYYHHDVTTVTYCKAYVVERTSSVGVIAAERVKL